MTKGLAAAILVGMYAVGSVATSAAAGAHGWHCGWVRGHRHPGACRGVWWWGLVADDPPAVDWLEDMGVVAVDENGAWRLTALGEEAMARFNGRHRAAPVICL